MGRVAQPGLSAAAGECGGDAVEPVAEPFGFPPSGRVTREGEELHPGFQLAGQGDEGAPDLVLGEAVEREVGESGGLGVPDLVLTAGPAAVAQFQVGQLAAAGVGFERSAGGYGYNNAFVGVERAAVLIGAGTGWRLVNDRVGSRRDLFRTPERTVEFADAALADGNGTCGVIEYSFIEPRFWPDAPAARPDPSVHFRHRFGSGSTKADAAAMDTPTSTPPASLGWMKFTREPAVPFFGTS